MTDRHQVDLFLRLMREAANTSFRLERRPENMATLAELEITVADAKSRILRLTADDYYRGPRPRAGHSIHEAWEFGLRVKRVEVYVKLEVKMEPSKCLCVSFHRPDRPIRYPLKKD